MAEGSPTGDLRQVVCPHCKKPFEAELLTGGSDRHVGFKCPHCRLFVAYDRGQVEEAEEPEGSR
jgi:transposase-like protein